MLAEPIMLALALPPALLLLIVLGLASGDLPSNELPAVPPLAARLEENLLALKPTMEPPVIVGCCVVVPSFLGGAPYPAVATVVGWGLVDKAEVVEEED